ncbi:carbohydrate esterase family 15 protein [Xylariomycetidae sp. FL2044]|nr:carbohydrate esterase family 15 protein [Xylariomycetidae sp. FL2044]
MKPLTITSLGLLALAQGQEYLPTPSSCTLPTAAAYPETGQLPDPFLKADGSRVASADDWACKRAEIRDQLQQYELGVKPPKPTVTATMSGNTISITCSEAGNSISFSVTVSKPSSGGSAGPFPAVIAFGFASIPVPAGVATITYNNQDIAADLPRGGGKFFALYGSSANEEVGALMAWAWGVSRIVDALEQLGAGTTGIDASRLAVTGCSRNGKGALVAGAFDDRIALVLPQEGGSGGPGCWRIAASMKANGTAVEDAAQIVTGDQWFRTAFTAYTTPTELDTLPYDHHMLMALVAPRALLVIENSGIDYLGPVSTFGCATAARRAYEGFGIPTSMGISQASHGSSHCSMPSSQDAEVAAFFARFLLGQDGVETDYVKTDGDFDFSPEQWIGWEAPEIAL